MAQAIGFVLIVCFVIGLIGLIIQVIAFVLGALAVLAIGAGIIWFIDLLITEGYVKARTLIMLLILAIAVPALTFGGIAFREYQSPKASLDREISRISDMERKLAVQLERLERTRRDYASDLARYQQGVLEELQRHTAPSLESANGHVRHLIRMIQETEAFDAKTAEYEAITRSGIDDSTILRRRLEAQKNISGTLGAGDNLSKEIEELFRRYQPYGEKLNMEMKDLPIKSSEEIWKSFIASP